MADEIDKRLEENKDKLMDAWLRLVDTIGRSHSGFFKNAYSISNSLSGYDGICKYAYDRIVEYNKKFEEYLVSEVGVYDIVTVSIDDGAPVCYYIGDGEDNNYEMESLDFTDKSNLGYFLIGKLVGFAYKYSDSESKKEHSITILANRKTDESVKFDKNELDAFIEGGKGLSR